MIWFIVFLQVLDGISTYCALSHTGLKEGNKVIAKLIGKIGLVPALLCVKVPFIALVLAIGDMAHPYALAIVCVLYAGIVTNNIYKLVKSL